MCHPLSGISNPLNSFTYKVCTVKRQLDMVSVWRKIVKNFSSSNTSFDYAGHGCEIRLVPCRLLLLKNTFRRCVTCVSDVMLKFVGSVTYNHTTSTAFCWGFLALIWIHKGPNSFPCCFCTITFTLEDTTIVTRVHKGRVVSCLIDFSKLKLQTISFGVCRSHAWHTAVQWWETTSIHTWYTAVQCWNNKRRFQAKMYHVQIGWLSSHNHVTRSVEASWPQHWHRSAMRQRVNAKFMATNVTKVYHVQINSLNNHNHVKRVLLMLLVFHIETWDTAVQWDNASMQSSYI